MKQRSNHASVYIRFLHLVKALREVPSFPDIDSMEERLLNQLALAWNTGAKVSVMEAMQMLPDASSTTVHRRLKTLRKKGIISLAVDEADNRVKYVMPTLEAQQYFSRLDDCLAKAVRA